MHLNSACPRCKTRRMGSESKSASLIKVFYLSDVREDEADGEGGGSEERAHRHGVGLLRLHVN